MAEDVCYAAGCVALVEDPGYCECSGCGAMFCSAHLLYCTSHNGQHCEGCCDEDIPQPKHALPWEVGA